MAVLLRLKPRTQRLVHAYRLSCVHGTYHATPKPSPFTGVSADRASNVNSPRASNERQAAAYDDPARGDTITLLESELLSSLEAALQEHANRYKVWNLSLGSDEVCSLDDMYADLTGVPLRVQQALADATVSDGERSLQPLCAELRAAVRSATGLSVAQGVGSTRTVARSIARI